MKFDKAIIAVKTFISPNPPTWYSNRSTRECVELVFEDDTTIEWNGHDERAIIPTIEMMLELGITDLEGQTKFLAIIDAFGDSMYDIGYSYGAQGN